MKRLALLLGISLSAIVTLNAQRAKQTVTNDDLARFRNERLKAERDYRNNYEKLGLPSPEELEERRLRDLNFTLDYAAELRQARMQQDRVQVERERVNAEYARIEAERAESQAEAERAASERRNPNFGYYGYPGYNPYGGYYYPNPYGRYGQRYPYYGRPRIFPFLTK